MLTRLEVSDFDSVLMSGDLNASIEVGPPWCMQVIISKTPYNIKLPPNHSIIMQHYQTPNTLLPVLCTPVKHLFQHLISVSYFFIFCSFSPKHIIRFISN